MVKQFRSIIRLLMYCILAVKMVIRPHGLLLIQKPLAIRQSLSHGALVGICPMMSIVIATIGGLAKMALDMFGIISQKKVMMDKVIHLRLILPPNGVRPPVGG